MSMDHQQWLEQHDRMISDMNNTLRRAIRMGVKDARRQRTRNAEFDQKMTQIAAAQLVNEELLKQNEGLLKRFLERGGNGAAK